MEPPVKFQSLLASSYNSAVYGSISSTDYFAFSVSKSFIESPECLNCNKNVTSSLAYYYRIWPGTRNPLDYDASNVSTIVRSLHARRNELERLDPSNCLNEYGVIVQSNRRNVLLVADDKNFPTPNENYFINGSYVFWATPFDSSDAKQTMFANDAYKWICTGSRDSTPCSDRIESIRAASSEWRAGLTCKDTVFDNCTTTAYPVEYCLSEKAEPHCRLVFDTGIAILVTVLNFGKLFHQLSIFLFWLEIFVLYASGNGGHTQSSRCFRAYLEIFASLST